MQQDKDDKAKANKSIKTSYLLLKLSGYQKKLAAKFMKIILNDSSG